MHSRSPLAILALLLSAAVFPANSLSQEKPSVQRTEQTDRTTQLTSLPELVFKLNSGGIPVDLEQILRAFYVAHPDVVTGPLKQFPPFADKTFTMSRDPTGSGVFLSQDRIAVIVRQSVEASEGEGELRIRVILQFRPPPMVNSNLSPAEFGKKLFKLSREIAQKTVDLFPDFSRDYIKKTLTERESRTDKLFQEADRSVGDLHREISHDTGLPSEKAAEQLAEISRQQIAAELSLVGMAAREKAIAIEIAKCKERVEQNEVRDETLANLQRLLKLRMERLEKQKQLQQSGVITEPEVQAAEADVLSAKIDLDKTRATLKRAGGGEQLDAYTSELSRLAIERAETQARRDWLQKMSQEISQNLSDRREAERRIESVKPKLAEAEHDRETDQNQLREIRQSLENVQPLHLVLPEDPSSDESRP